MFSTTLYVHVCVHPVYGIRDTVMKIRSVPSLYYKPSFHSRLLDSLLNSQTSLCPVFRLLCVFRTVRPAVLNSDRTDGGSAFAGQAAVHLAWNPALYFAYSCMSCRQNTTLDFRLPSTWPVVGLTMGQSALAAGVHCPIILTTRSTPNSTDDCAGRAH